ncbi:glucosyltransferase [Micromonospora sp. ATCC 39149]|uniref:glycosyltransferase n=1 Tax=Micromonospora sp. (strain ATCC 39149 / NRRL 15099 / SCC 1413) TaxID=219305 RepID=UPI0001A505EB|nr:glycosyltransferase [Micromonospora sp. ATCC 39149]EEP75159.1 glucosyltransferase [Micromonospora sp. ATCC 39149]
MTPGDAGTPQRAASSRTTKSSAAAPLISVIVPAYNRSPLLRGTLAALAGQRMPTERYEVVVADDGSTDDTPQIVDAFTDRLCLRYHFQPDLGFRAAAARNAGTRLAAGGILAFVDTGVLPGPDFLAAHARPGPTRAVLGYTYGYRPDDPTPGLEAATRDRSPEEIVRAFGTLASFWDGRHATFASTAFDLSRVPLTWQLRALDVTAELARLRDTVPPGARIAVFGCGGELPAGFPPAHLFDYDETLLARLPGDPARPARHALDIRTVLPDDAVDVVLLTSRMTPLWRRWRAHLLAEAPASAARCRGRWCRRPPPRRTPPADRPHTRPGPAGRPRAVRPDTRSDGHSPEPGTRQIISSVSGTRSAKQPVGEDALSNARRSASNSASRAPNRCGAPSDRECTHATTSSTDRHATARERTRNRVGPANPAPARTSASPPGVPCGSNPRPARRTGPR